MDTASAMRKSGMQFELLYYGAEESMCNMHFVEVCVKAENAAKYNKNLLQRLSDVICLMELVRC